MRPSSSREKERERESEWKRVGTTRSSFGNCPDSTDPLSSTSSSSFLNIIAIISKSLSIWFKKRRRKRVRISRGSLPRLHSNLALFLSSSSSAVHPFNRGYLSDFLKTNEEGAVWSTVWTRHALPLLLNPVIQLGLVSTLLYSTLVVQGRHHHRYHYQRPLSLSLSSHCRPLVQACPVDTRVLSRSSLSHFSQIQLWSRATAGRIAIIIVVYLLRPDVGTCHFFFSLPFVALLVRFVQQLTISNKLFNTRLWRIMNC